MDISNGDAGHTDNPEPHEVDLLPDKPGWLIVLLLLLAATGVVISLLQGSLGVALGACFLALWAAAAVTVVVAVAKRMLRMRSRRRNKPGLPSAERRNQESIPATQVSVAPVEGRRKWRWRQVIIIVGTRTFDDES